jgi:class 3 adenylate cyclase/tetratricopeptide (TPR) repeat protein
MDIGSWLRRLGLGQYEAAFYDNEIDDTVLATLTAEDLKDLGVGIVGHRRKLLDAIAALRTDLVAKPLAASAPDQQTRKDTAERRQLTVMFCDLVGSTGLSARLDPEEMRDLIAVYRKCVTDAVAQFDGFVAQYLGDGVLVYLGYPQAHEDDAERAVKAGLAVVAAVDSIKGQVAGQLKARVGIATGLVVVGEQMGAGASQERAAIGETPNLAARLQGIAAPGAVVISASTRRLVGRMFDCDSLGAIVVKGLPQPIEAWRVRGELVGVSRFEALRAAALTPLVGRQEEIELLLRRWHQAKLGEGRVVLLAGEPGIGKSRIAESLLVGLEGEPHVRLRYFCSPHHTHSALYPFIAQLERAAGFEPGSDTGARLDKLDALLKPTARSVPQDLVLIAELLAVPLSGRYPVVEVSPQQKREMTLTALLDQLDGIAARSPVLIIFEDAHWIDPTSLDLLDRTVARVADLPVLLVMTFRPELQPTWVGQPHVTMLSLSRLGRRDGAAIIAGVTKGKALPDGVAEQILARTDGVPLFIEELTSALLESGLMRETSDRYVLDGPLPQLAIPTTLQASLVARLDRLATVKDVAQIGAAIGREFSHELIAAVASMTPADLDTALERLAASGLISRRGMPPHATYSFKHALVQDAAYATLLKSRRQQLHASIAKVLVERFPTLAESQLEVVAHHYSEAGLASEAIGYWRKAGQLASARSANREAVGFFEQALGVLASLPETQSTLEQTFDIRLELRETLNLLNEPRRALDRLLEAETLAERLNDDRRRGQVCALMTIFHTLFGEVDDALASGTRALEIANRLGDLRLRILATSSLAQANYRGGDYERVVALATDNLAVLPAEWVYQGFGISGPPSVTDRCWLIMSLAQLGRFAEAVEPGAEAIRLAAQMQHAYTVGWAHWGAGKVHLLWGDWAKARPRFENATAVARAGNAAFLLSSSVASSAYILAQLGEASEALSRLRECEQRVEHHVASGYSGSLGWFYMLLGRTALALGRLDDSMRLGDRAIESSSRMPGFAAHAWHLHGDIATHPDRFNAERAKAHYAQALALAEPRGMRPLVAHCHLGLGKLYRHTGKRQEAQEHLTMATTMYREMDMTYWLERAVAETNELA